MEPTLIGYIYIYYIGLNVLAFSLRELQQGRAIAALCVDSHERIL